MRECSQEDGQAEAYENILGTKATRFQTGLMMDGGLTTGEWWNPQNDNKRVNSTLSQLRNSALALGQ